MTVYKKTSKIILHARQSGDSEEIKSALSYFADSVSAALVGSLNISTFAEFITDADSLFKYSRNILSRTGPDVNMFTTGLVSQLLEMIGVSAGEKISDDLRDALFDLHAKISSGSNNIDIEKSRLTNTIHTLAAIIP